MIVMSLMGVVGFADFGLANGLLNAVAEAKGLRDQRKLTQAVSSAFFMLLGLAVLLASIFVIVYPWMPWRSIFNISSPIAAAEVGPAVAVFVACFLCNIPLGVIQRIHMGLQEGYVNSLWVTVGSLATMLSVLLVAHDRLSLSWFVLALAGAPAVATLLNGIQLVGYSHTDLSPKWSQFSAPVANRIAKAGLMFFVLQLAFALAFSSDSLIIAQVLGPASVSTYMVVQKLFSFPSMLLGFILAPLWPAYGESLARGDSKWIRRTLRRSVAFAAVATLPAALFLCFAGKWLTVLWVGKTVAPSSPLLAGFAIWTMLNSVRTAAAYFLNGVSVLRTQVILDLLFACVSLPLKIWLAFTIGLHGIIWGTIIAYSLCSLFPTIWVIRKWLANMTAENRFQ